MQRLTQKNVELHGCPLRVELTESAVHAAQSLRQPLVAEIHLILGCLIVKRVWFKSPSEVSTTPVMGKLVTGFRVVRYSKACRIAHIDSQIEEPTDFPLEVGLDKMMPQWLRVDFNSGNWQGTFGYD